MKTIVYADVTYSVPAGQMVSARKAIRLANDEGTIQATDARKVFGGSRPELHTTMGVDSALRALGCREV